MGSAKKALLQISLLTVVAVFISDFNRKSFAEITNNSNSSFSEDVQIVDNLIALNIGDTDASKASFTSLDVSTSSSEHSKSETSYSFSTLNSSESLSTVSSSLKSSSLYETVGAGSGSSLVDLNSSSSIDKDAFDSVGSSLDSADQLSSNNNQGGYYWYNRRNKKQRPSSSSEGQTTLKQALNSNSQNTFASLSSLEAPSVNSSDASSTSFVDTTNADNDLKVSSIDSVSDRLTNSTSSSLEGGFSSSSNSNSKSNSILFTSDFSSQNTNNKNVSHSSTITNDQFSSSFASAF